MADMVSPTMTYLIFRAGKAGFKSIKTHRIRGRYTYWRFETINLRITFFFVKQRS
jgi:hypothetical protein